jgi:hypothetical protein
MALRRARAPLHAAATAWRRAASSGAGSASSAGGVPVRVHNPDGAKRVVVTKDLPGARWLDILTAANCRVEVRMRAADTHARSATSTCSAARRDACTPSAYARMHTRTR